MRVFISYSHADEGFAERLLSDLVALGIEAQMLGHEGRGLDPRFNASHHQKALFVPVLSEAAISSGTLEGELETFFRLGALAFVVMPVLASRCFLPEALGLNVPVDFTESYTHGLSDLTAQLSAAVEVESSRRGSAASQRVAKDLFDFLHPRNDKRFESLMSVTGAIFEEMIASILTAQWDCQVDVTCRVRHSSIDLVALGGRNSSGSWLIQCKRYQIDGRFGVESVASLQPVHWNSRDPSFSVVAATWVFMGTPSHSPDRAQPNLDCWHMDRGKFTSLVQWLSDSPQLGPAVRRPIDYAHERYGELAEKRLTNQLSQDELVELAAVESLLDRHEEKFYARSTSLLRSEAGEGVIDRHAALIDKKFEIGLTPEESDELKKIERQLEEEESSFYKPLKQHLRDILAKLD